MITIDGYALERISTNEELAWWERIPSTVRVPGESITVDAASAGWEFEDYRIVERSKEFPDPEPARRMIEKSTIMERLTDAQLETALSLMSTRQKERWRMPGHPSVYVDDPEVLALIQAIGANADEVLA